MRLLHWDGRRMLLRRGTGNEAPEVSVEALLAADGEAGPLSDDRRVWSLILQEHCVSPTRSLVGGSTSESSTGPRLQASLFNHRLIHSQLREIEHVP